MFGLDYLGGAMFSGVLLKAHPSGWAAGFFADTFGSIWSVVDKLAATGKCPLFRIHGPWTAHAYNPSKHDKAIFAAFDRTLALAAKYPHLQFQFSPVCESSARGAAWAQLFARLDSRQQNAARRLQLVCSIHDGQAVKGYLLEVHGKVKAPTVPFQYSYDGTSTVDSDVETDKATYGRAQIIFFWHPSFNLKYKTKLGKKEQEDPNVWKNDTAPPKERECKPTVELILSVVALAQRKGPAKLKARNTWKSHADRHKTPPEERAYKPVFISPEKVTTITLVDSSGIVIAKSTKREPYNDGRFRYYFGNYGYQIANKVLTVLAGKTELGTVNPPFREGDFR